MPHYLSDAELKRTAPAEVAAFRGPIPTQIVSNGEYNPLPQTEEQRKVEARVTQLASDLAPKHGLSRRKFLATSAGMAAAFIAMNEVFGPVFEVSRAEAATPGVADLRAQALSGQFIVDCQTHFVRDDFKQEGLLDLAKYAKTNWNPKLWGESKLERYKFENYVKEIFVDSDTKVALLSGAPFDDSSWDLLSNDQIIAARTSINKFAGSRRLLGHSVFTPKKDGWMDQVDRAISTLKPDSWVATWVLDKGTPSDERARLLKHEQGHYDIVALLARDLFNEIMAIKAKTFGAPDDPVDAVKEILDTYDPRFQSLQDLYDGKTGHGLEAGEQTRWNGLIARAFGESRLSAELSGPARPGPTPLVDVLKDERILH